MTNAKCRMTRLTGMFAAAVIAAATLGGQELPPPFPRDDAKLIVENDRVRVWDVKWPKGKPTAMHRHPYDLIGTFLVGSAIKVTMPDGTSRESVAQFAQTVF